MTPSAPLGAATRDMILSLLAAGVSPDEVAAMYPDIPRDTWARELRRALRKAPMFLTE